MININCSKRNKKAVTLAEILLACVLMALAFLPIMGLMSSSIKITEQDENTQRAVRLCQEKLNIVMQMPYDTFGKSITSKMTLDTTDKKNKDIALVLGEEVFDGIPYKSILTIEPYTVIYHVPTCDFSLKGADTKKAAPNPANWGWTDLTYTVTGKVLRYSVTVKWKDHGKSNEKEYTLSTLKADLRKK